MELKIFDVGYSGEGISKADGKVCFVPFSLQDEIVDAKIINETPKFNECEVVKVIEPSKDRISASCPYFSLCGGCDLQYMKYEKQLEFKKNLIKNTFLKIAALDVNVLDVVPSQQFNYRNKMVFECQDEKVGMFKKNSHTLVETKSCMLAPEEINKVLNIFQKFLSEYNIPSYDEKTKAGIIKRIVIRKVENILSIVIVSTTKNFPKLNILVEMLPKNIQLFLNINNDDNKILSTNFVHIYGPKEIFKTEFEVRYPVSPFSFMQVNDEIKEKLYSFVLENINSKIVIDAYSGAGLLSAIISKKTEKVVAVEISRSACRDANNLLKNNGIKNVEVICDDCLNVLPNLKDLENSTVVLDPPRAGVDKKILKVLNKNKPQKIIYISCNPKTLARDVLELKDYKIKTILPFDMFPQTANVETVVILTK